MKGVVGSGAVATLAACAGDAGSGALPTPTPAPPEAYTLSLLDDVRITSQPGDTFQHARATFELTGAPFARAVLVLELRSTCFPFEQWRNDPPPAGHRWPPGCDAFDRNFEVTIDPPEADGDPPAIELLRAITPFGGPLHVETDVTDFANARPGPHTMDVHISTWSDGGGQVSGSAGGWNVSARLQVTPGRAPRRVLAVLPLVNGGVGAGAPPPEVAFTLPEGTVRGRLEYRATGHGGATDTSAACIGPAEEFCRRTHHLFIDAGALAPFVPWRDDCADLCSVARYEGDALQPFEYCAENPTGAMDSVRAPRANWCPGSVTPPFRLNHAGLGAPGAHAFRYVIDDVAPGGSWRVSAAVYAYGE